jgi:hypothetical protein
VVCRHGWLLHRLAALQAEVAGEDCPMRFLTLGDVAAQFPYVDEPNALELAKSSRAMQSALEMIRPRNWWGSGLKPDLLLTMAEVDGIPVAWLPPKEILAQLVDTPDRAGRVAYLNDHKAEVAADIRALLSECRDPWVQDDQFLLVRALDAFEAGHHEAAMALGVSIAEPLAAWASTPRVISFDSNADMEIWEKARKKVRT